MKAAITLAIVLISAASTAHAQVSDSSFEEAKARLAERQKARATQPSASPTSRPAPALLTKIVKKLKLKDGAPDLVQTWFAMLPAYKAERIAEMDRELEGLEKEYKQIVGSSTGTVVTARVFGGTMVTPDERSGVIKSNAAKAKWAEVLAQRKKVAEAREDGSYIAVPRMSFRVGSYGTLGGGLRIQQVVDKSNMIIIGPGDRWFWLKGFDAKNSVDDSPITIDDTVACTGTKTYNTAIGSTKTVLVVEPLDLTSWVETLTEVVEVKPPAAGK